MRNHRLWKFLYSILFSIAGIAWFLSIIAAPSLKANPSDVGKWWPLGAEILSTSQQHVWLAIPLLIIVHAVTKALYNRIGAPRKWRNVQQLLDNFQRHIFERETAGALHHHRVTLFKYVAWLPCFEKWPWDGWLKAVLRSHYTTQKRRVRFRAPDDADRVEGVAGQTWAANEILIVDELDDIEGGDSELVREYARKTWMPERWVKTANKKTRPRSLCGIPIEVKGKVWGVIVLDSRGPRSIHRDASSKRFYKLMGRLLADHLEGR